MTKYQRKKSIPAVLVFLIGVFTLIPNTTSGQYVRMAILLIGIVVDILGYKNYKVDIEIAKIIALMIGSVFISAVSVFVVERHLNSNLVVHELVRLAMNIILLLLLYNRKTKFKNVYIICVITVLCVFIVQVLQSIAPELTNIYIRKYYTNPDASAHHLNLALETNRGFFRAGAFLINPNICGCAITLCCPFFYIGLKMKKYNKISLLMLVISFLSVLLSGSRTSLIVFAVIGVLYFFDREMSIKKKIATVSITVVGVIILIVLMSQGLSISNYRSFNLAGALHQSLFDKIEIFGNYFIQAHPLYWITGSIGGFSSKFQMDAEWGYVLSYFGIIGLVWYIKILQEIKRVNISKYRCFSRQYQISVALVGITETVFLCMPLAPLLILTSLTDASEE